MRGVGVSTKQMIDVDVQPVSVVATGISDFCRDLEAPWACVYFS